MPFTIDEVTAEVSPPPDRAASTAGASPGPQTPSPYADQRKVGEQLQHLHQRTARVRAD